MKTEEYLKAIRACKNIAELRDYWMRMANANLKAIEAIQIFTNDKDALEEMLETTRQEFENICKASAIAFGEVSDDPEFIDKATMIEAYIDTDEPTIQ